MPKFKLLSEKQRPPLRVRDSKQSTFFLAHQPFCYNCFMKFLKKILVSLLMAGIIIGVIWGIGEFDKFKVQNSKFKVAEEQKIAGNPLKFAVMSDIHSDWGNFRKALSMVKGNFVIVTGDLTTLGKKSELSEAKKILDESGLKYFIVPGNHDIWWGRKYKKDVWKEVFGKSYQSFKEGKVKFILVNNGDGEGGFGGFGQGEWLKKETEECLKIYCLVFMHMPLNHPTSLHVMGEGNSAVASETAQLIRLFADDKVREVFAGHLHFSSSYEQEGLKTNIVGAVAADRNFQSPKFLEVTIENGDLSKKEMFLE